MTGENAAFPNKVCTGCYFSEPGHDPCGVAWCPCSCNDEHAVPFPARKAMQDAIWNECIRPADNEWTTWTDAITLAETAADGLVRAGWTVVALDAQPPSAQAFTAEDYEAAATAITEGMRIAGARSKAAGSSDYKQLLTPAEFADRCIEVAGRIAASRHPGSNARDEAVR